MKLKKIVSQLSDRRWRRFYLQRRFMRPHVRARVSARIARGRGEPVAADPAAQAVAEALRRDGLADLGTLLSPADCEAIRAFFTEKEVFDHYRPQSSRFKPHGAGRDPACHVAYHLDEDVVDAPRLLEIANDPRILAALHQYFGCRPLISGLSAWWSYPTDVAPQQAENFHRDVDDWSFIKLFVYLTDVGMQNGPHIYVRGSAASAKLAAIKRFGDEEVVGAFGEGALSIQTGAAGDAFLENTFGLHKGKPVEQGMRLVFQAIYSLNPIPYGPLRPLASFDGRLAGDDGLREVNRVYLS